jgi:hypothetical protein
MGEWLAGIVRDLSTETGWPGKTAGQQAADLRRAVVNRITTMRAGDNERLKTYFHYSDGTWDTLLAAIRTAYPSTASRGTSSQEPPTQ